jgi:hypothetical protein
LWSHDFPPADRQGCLGCGCSFHGSSEAGCQMTAIYSPLRTCPIRAEFRAEKFPYPLKLLGKIMKKVSEIASDMSEI